jgi:hypothetical protein
MLMQLGNAHDGPTDAAEAIDCNAGFGHVWILLRTELNGRLGNAWQLI